MDELLNRLNEALTNDEIVTLITVIESPDPSIIIGNKLLIRHQEQHGTLGSERLDRVATQEIQENRELTDTFTRWGDQLRAIANEDYRNSVLSKTEPRIRLLFEILRPQPCLIICGAGHIARALVQLGAILGFRAIVIDDRAEFANRDYFPQSEIDLRIAPFTEAVSQLKIKPYMSIVIVTRGHKYDEDCLRLLLSTPAQYLGMIGSRRRITVVKEKLIAEGFSSAQLAKLHAPIGLNIGARSPEEIALAILAEIILVRNRGLGISDSLPMSHVKKF